MATTVHVHTHQPGPAPSTHEVKDQGLQDLQQQARDFRVPKFSPPWSHKLHPNLAEARDGADAWARVQFRALAGSERFTRILSSDSTSLLTPGAYNSGPASGLEYANMYMLFLFFVDDTALATSTTSATPTTDLAQITLELLLVMMSSFPRDKVLQESLETILAVDEKWALEQRVKIDEFLACAMKQPGTVDYCDFTKDKSPITLAWRDLWKRATSTMPQDWCLRFAHIGQRDMIAMFRETEERQRNLGSPRDSISEYMQKRREYGFGECALIVGELAERIQISNAAYYCAPMQSLVQATVDVMSWHNDIQSFQKELLAGEVNLVYLISKKEGRSYNRAAEIVNDMVVDRCKDLSIAAAEVRHHADSGKEPFLDSENAEKHILLCTNFISATHVFHERSSRFRDEKLWTARCD